MRIGWEQLRALGYWKDVLSKGSLPSGTRRHGEGKMRLVPPLCLILLLANVMLVYAGDRKDNLIGQRPDLSQTLTSLAARRGSASSSDLCLIVGKVMQTTPWVRTDSLEKRPIWGKTISTVEVDTALVGTWKAKTVKLTSLAAVFTYGRGSIYYTAVRTNEPRLKSGDRVIAIIDASLVDPLSKRYPEFHDAVVPVYVGFLTNASSSTVFAAEYVDITTEGREYAKALIEQSGAVGLSDFYYRTLAPEITVSSLVREITSIRSEWEGK